MYTGHSEQEKPDGAAVTPADILELVHGLAQELRPHRTHALTVTLDSALERDLGFDSLGRVELLHRLERAFDISLPEQLLSTAETPRDLLRAVHGAHGGSRPLHTRTVSHEALGEVEALPSQAPTLMDVLAWHTASHPERPHIHLYGDTEQAEVITYAALHERAIALAAGLQQRDVQAGQTVAIMLPTCREFFESFYGILLAGAIPVPIYPPMRPSQIEEHLRRQVGILSNAQSVMLITVPEAQPVARLLRPHVRELRHVVTVPELTAEAAPYRAAVRQAQDIAFLQYTSGSTGNPKGVILTHANLLANLRVMGQGAQTTSNDVFVSWLPLYHDMGLIGAWLGSLYYAFPLVLMSPLTFLARPERWLWAIHQHRGTISGAPNFAYELCVRRIADEDIAGLDLSSWRMAFNGAEQVSPESIRRFCDRFSPYGFKPEAMAPVYGLAETSLGLAFSPPGRGVHIDRIQREPFMRTGHAIPAAEDDSHALSFVACGQPLADHHIRIVDATGYEVAERHEGRLEFRGPSATSGYFRQAEATRDLFHDSWLDSGDLAYIAAGDVYITGRAKDIIIRAGHNLYPHELEEAIGNIAGVRKGCVAVFGSADPATRTERLVVLAETRETEAQARDDLRRQIDHTVMDILGTPADEVVLVAPQTVLKTSSGKIRRAACRERYERGHLDAQTRAVWWQLTRLALASVRPQLARTTHLAAEVLYAAYVWILFGLSGSLLWGAVALLRRRTWAQTVTQKVTRLMLRLAGVPLSVAGLEHIPAQAPCVLVINHASYLDALVVTATLPCHVAYVAKQELERQFFAGLLLRRLGTQFVERFDPQRGVEDTSRLLKAAQRGQTLVFFPEGTFNRAPGLLPFRLGAFVVAAQAGLPVVPVAISGTRSILRAGQWFLRHGRVRVTIGAPILPSGNDWSAAVALRDAAREQILRHCGEPDAKPA